MKLVSGIAFLIVFLLPSLTLQAQSTLKVDITGLRNSKGRIAFELVDKNNENVRGDKYEIMNNKCTVVLKNLKDGQYAIRLFHDENSNDEVEKNFIGIPKEGVGFSNDAIGKFGPKKFDKWLFPIKGETDIKIKIFYW